MIKTGGRICGVGVFGIWDSQCFGGGGGGGGGGILASGGDTEYRSLDAFDISDIRGEDSTLSLLNLTSANGITSGCGGSGGGGAARDGGGGGV